jgi:hypothetical protein
MPGNESAEILKRTRGEGAAALWSRETLRTLYVNHEMTCHEIADHIGCGIKTVRRRLNRPGIEHRHLGARGSG